MATRLEQEYENTIQLYLNNGYQIVSQTDNTTIMLSDFVKVARQSAKIQRVVSSAIVNYDLALTADLAAAGVQGNEYQATIRITKTGQLQVSGFTLDTLNKIKLQREKAKSKDKSRATPAGWIFLVIALIMTVFFLVALGESVVYIIWFPLILMILGIGLIVYGKRK